MKFLNYNTKDKIISQVKFDKNLTAKTESIFSLGNGYLGIRSADEELAWYNKEDFFVNGIFNRDVKEEVSELANLADCLSNPIFINGRIFTASHKDFYNKSLDIKKGILSRKIIAKRSQSEIEFNFERFVSQDDLNVYGQKIKIKVLKATKENNFLLKVGINGQVTNQGTQHFSEGHKFRPTNESLQMHQQTTNSKRFVVHNLITKLYLNGKLIKGGTDDYVIDIDRRRIVFNINLNLKEKDELVLEKLMSVHTSVDSKNKTISKEKVLANANEKHNYLLSQSYDNLKEKSIKAFEKNVWEKYFVKIQGNEESSYDQLALDFALFHLNNFVPKFSTTKNVGAKGLSGEGYQGHTYWDTEFFINPNYLFNDPSVVKNLLTYRYKGIKGARDKAKEFKQRYEESYLEGAQFPWEMAWPTEGEVCPYWGQADIISGEQVPIASRRQEIHVSSDIAYAVEQYYRATNDEKFMEKMGYEMIFDTAWFYTNRAEKQSDNSFEIKDIMGPNEYKGNIDNNAFINFMAKYNIDLAINYYKDLESKNKDLLKKVLSKIPYKIDLEKMKLVSQNLVQQKPNDQKIIAENDQFLKLPLVDLSSFQMRGDAGKKLFSTKEGTKILSSQVVKQADVVLLLNIFPNLYDYETKRKNFDYYEKITTHDSSLSPATYCLEAIRLRKLEIAYKLFKYGINIDLGENMKSSNAGIHAGSLAAIYQMIVFGYGGLNFTDGKLFFDPVLPSNWNQLTYKFKYLNCEFLVNVYKDKFSIKCLTKDKAREIYIENKKYLITNKEEFFKIKHAN